MSNEKITEIEVDGEVIQTEPYASNLDLKKISRKLKRDKSVAEIRTELGLSQAQFAAQYCLNLNTLQKWEQQKNEVTPVAKAYYELIRKAPKLVSYMLHKSEKDVQKLLEDLPIDLR